MTKTRFTTTFCNDVSDTFLFCLFFQHWITFARKIQETALLGKEDFLLWSLSFFQVERALRIQASVERCEKVAIPLAVRALTESDAHYLIRVRYQTGINFLMDQSGLSLEHTNRTLPEMADFLGQELRSKT